MCREQVTHGWLGIWPKGLQPIMIRSPPAPHLFAKNQSEQAGAGWRLHVRASLYTAPAGATGHASRGQLVLLRTVSSVELGMARTPRR